jgi:hypothetical protein
MEQGASGVTRGREEGVLQPEVILPSQLAVGTRLDARLQPEKRLLLAVLEDAVAAFQRHTLGRTRRAERLFAEVEAWFASDANDWPFAFVNVCHALGLDVHYMRAGLRRWRERARADRHGAMIFVRAPFRHMSGTRTRVTEMRVYA